MKQTTVAGSKEIEQEKQQWHQLLLRQLNMVDGAGAIEKENI
jgi:hypothetical protein